MLLRWPTNILFRLLGLGRPPFNCCWSFTHTKTYRQSNTSHNTTHWSNKRYLSGYWVSAGREREKTMRSASVRVWVTRWCRGACVRAAAICAPPHINNTTGKPHKCESTTTHHAAEDKSKRNNDKNSSYPTTKMSKRANTTMKENTPHRTRRVHYTRLQY